MPAWRETVVGPDVQEKTAESPQVQFLDVGIPVVVPRQVAVQLSTPTAGGASDSFIDKVFDV